MGTDTYTNTLHIGRKIERVRRLRGMTQTDLGDLLGVTKQAVSKMEQTEKIDDDKLILEKGEYILQKGKKSFAKILIK